MNGIIEDRSSVSSTDMLVSNVHYIHWTFGFNSEYPRPEESFFFFHTQNSQ